MGRMIISLTSQFNTHISPFFSPPSTGSLLQLTKSDVWNQAWTFMKKQPRAVLDLGLKCMLEIEKALDNLGELKFYAYNSPLHSRKARDCAPIVSWIWSATSFTEVTLFFTKSYILSGSACRVYYITFDVGKCDFGEIKDFFFLLI